MNHLVYAFCPTEENAWAVCREVNSHGVTCDGKFIPGMFRFQMVDGRVAVVGRLNLTRAKGQKGPELINGAAAQNR